MRYRALPGDHALAQLAAMTRCAGGITASQCAEERHVGRGSTTDETAAGGPRSRPVYAKKRTIQICQDPTHQRSKLPARRPLLVHLIVRSGEQRSLQMRPSIRAPSALTTSSSLVDSVTVGPRPWRPRECNPYGCLPDDTPIQLDKAYGIARAALDRR